MTIGFEIDADGTGSLLPTVVDTLFGFPSDNLTALYLLQDGTVGTAYTGVITDETDNAHHGGQLTGSGAIQLASGLGTRGDPANNAATGASPAGGYYDGFAFNTGVLISSSFSWVIVAKAADQYPGEQYPVLWQAGLPSALPMIGSTNRLTQNLLPSTANSQMLPDLLRNPVWPTTGINTHSFAVVHTPVTDRFCIAMSYDQTTGTFLRLMGGVTDTFTDKVAGDAMLAYGVPHVFGYARDAATRPQVDGELDLVALYSGASTITQLTALVAAAKAEMAERGITSIV